MRDERPTSMGSLYVKTKQGANPAVTRFQKSGNQGSDWKSLQLNLSLDSQTKVSGDVYVTDIIISRTISNKFQIESIGKQQKFIK